jgi:hypothetical protein
MSQRYKALTNRDVLWSVVKGLVANVKYAVIEVVDFSTAYPEIVERGVVENLAHQHGLSVVIDRRAKELIFRDLQAPDYENFHRANGDTVCATCNREYRLHPEPSLTFHVLCDGRTVKL